MAHRSIPSPSTRPPLPRSGALAIVDRVPERFRPLVVPALAVVVLGVVGWWLLRPAPAPTESTVPIAAAGSGQGDSPSAAAAGTVTSVAAGVASSTTTTEAGVVAQAAGAVRSPGLYRLAPGARVDDLIRAAGGLAGDADRDRINLASPVADGERVWVPPKGVAEVPDVVAGSGGGGGGAGGSGSGGSPGSGQGGATGGGGASGSGAAGPAAPVELNSADADELDSLPGVGPATASAIIAYREQSGPFRSVDDLLEVRGIGDAKLEALRPLVVVR